MKSRPPSHMARTGFAAFLETLILGAAVLTLSVSVWVFLVFMLAWTQP